MIKNDARVLLSSFILQICANKKEQFFDTILCYGFLDKFNIMILFIDEYGTVFRQIQKRNIQCLRRNWHFYECVYRPG